MKIPRSRKESAPRNVAAKALASGKFKPKVEPDPKAYKRRPKHPKPIMPPDDEPSS
jgi:hypothetical protein